MPVLCGSRCHRLCLRMVSSHTDYVSIAVPPTRTSIHGLRVFRIFYRSLTGFPSLNHLCPSLLKLSIGPLI